MFDIIPVENEPASIMWNPLNKNIYVTNKVDDTVSVINTFTHKVIATILVGDGPGLLTITGHTRNGIIFNINNS